MTHSSRVLDENPQALLPYGSKAFSSSYLPCSPICLCPSQNFSLKDPRIEDPLQTVSDQCKYGEQLLLTVDSVCSRQWDLSFFYKHQIKFQLFFPIPHIFFRNNDANSSLVYSALLKGIPQLPDLQSWIRNVINIENNRFYCLTETQPTI